MDVYLAFTDARAPVTPTNARDARWAGLSELQAVLRWLRWLLGWLRLPSWWWPMFTRHGGVADVPAPWMKGS